MATNSRLKEKVSREGTNLEKQNAQTHRVGRLSRGQLKLTSIAAILCLTGCATTGSNGGAASGAWDSVKNTFASDDPCANNARNIGVLAGSVIGIIVGKSLGDSVAAAAGGAAVGALLGGLIGNDMDRKRCELSKIAKQYDLDVRFEKITLNHDQQVSGNNESLSMTVRDNLGDGSQFKSNSDVMTARAETYFKAIAAQYASTSFPEGVKTEAQKAAWQNTMKSRRLLLVGHTDDTGSSKGNAELSERRARAVASFLKKQGIPEDQLYFQGAGEGYPLVANDTNEGRALNRRVEFIEVYGDNSLQKYIESRRPNYALYRHVPNSEVVSVIAESGKPTPQAVKSASAKSTKTPAGVKQAPVTVQPPQTTPVIEAIASKEAKVAQNTGTQDMATASVSTEPANRSLRPVINQAQVVDQAVSVIMDFGGAPYTNTSQLLALGGVKAEKSIFPIISSAQANVANAPKLSCTDDQPRVIGAVKALKDDKDFKTSDHLKGLYATSWHDMVNGNLIMLHGVSVLRDGTTPKQKPQLRLYANYDNNSNKKSAKPDWQGEGQVNTYRLDNGLLYRLFVPNAKGLKCLDMLFPSGGGIEAKAGKLLYQKSNALYVVDFKPKKNAP
jgi:hypothetical protein